MTTETTLPNSAWHFFNHHTGHPRFHFDAASDAAAAAAAAAAGGTKPWHDGVETETLGFWQNKGLPLEDPKVFAGKLTELYRQAEKHIGAPPDRILRLPDATAKPEEWTAFHQRLGAPKEAKEYDFSAIKNAKGEAIPEPLAETLRSTAFAKGLSKDAAAAVASAVVKRLDDDAAAAATITAGKIAEEKAGLIKNWGPEDSAKYKLNFIQASEGARRSGISQEGVKAMESQIGYAATMEHFRKIGANTSEANFHEGGGPQGVNTREGAASKLAELEADKAWGKRLAAGDAVATAEWRQLTAMISGAAA